MFFSLHPLSPLTSSLSRSILCQPVFNSILSQFPSLTLIPLPSFPPPQTGLEALQEEASELNFEDIADDDSDEDDAGEHVQLLRTVQFSSVRLCIAQLFTVHHFYHLRYCISDFAACFAHI
jgi:hypothetical protein